MALTMTRTRRPRRALAALGLGLAALAAVSTACNTDDILTEHPQTVIVPDNLYTDLAGFEAGLNALYAQVRRERSGSGSDLTNDMVATSMFIGTDNGYGLYVSPPERLFQQFTTYNTPLNSFTDDTWRLMYQTINAANTIINRADNPAVQWSETDKGRVVGEARLIRAWAYRHLQYLFGDVPVTLEESSGDNVRTDWERQPRDSVRQLIINDLIFARDHLPITSPDDGKLTKAVAQHYLAEMYLAIGDPAKAEVEASAVINDGVHHLITARYGVNKSSPGVPFMDQFQDGNVERSQGNTEALWVLQYAEKVNGGGSSIMRRSWVTRYESNKGMMLAPEDGGRGIGRLAITRYALNLYEPSDDRGGQYAIRRFYLYNNPANLPAGKKLGDTLFTVVGAEKASNPLWPSTRKWDWSDPADVTAAPQYNDQPYIRLAETYLLLAEAQFKQNNLAGAAATINVLRARANASLITPAQVTMNFILDERSRELVTEEERRYTLLRTGTWYDRVKQYNPLAAAFVQPRDSILPIPQEVIDANLTKPMPQNPGY
jgi:starch-binding outer membrane protein, SusD/RagB family